ncbi:MAG: tripartite tricarboxylate transporter substrate binding protein [Burkholderiaceae bacterium]
MKNALQRSLFSLLTGVFAGSLLLPAMALAQTRPWPEKPVRIIVPAPAGSAPDAIVRVLGQKLSETWGQSVTIDNVVGASGNIGTDRVAKAAADGYTLLFNTIGPIAVNVTLFEGKLPYDPVKDLAPISLVVKMPNLLTVNPGVPIKSLNELIAAAKKDPGKLRYGTAGPGTTQHLSGELLNTLAGIKLTSIPYKSSAQMTTDAIGGQIEVLFHNAPVLLPHIKAGTLRPLAITSAKRSASSPEVPTMAEAGVSGFEITAWFGFMAPAATPPALIRKISTDVARIVATPEIQERILSQASEPVGSTPEAYAAFIQTEISKWRDVIKQANITAN